LDKEHQFDPLDYLGREFVPVQEEGDGADIPYLTTIVIEKVLRDHLKRWIRGRTGGENLAFIVSDLNPFNVAELDYPFYLTLKGSVVCYPKCGDQEWKIDFLHLFKVPLKVT